MTKAISVSGLRKAFGRTHALEGLDLEVEAGEVHGFLGPNGSGKSTTVRVLLGLLRADSGAAQMLGMDPWSDAVELHRRVAYVPGDVTLWRNLSGGEVIDLYGRLHGGGAEASTRHGGPASSSASNWTPPRRAAPTRRATARRSRSSPRSPPTSTC